MGLEKETHLTTSAGHGACISACIRLRAAACVCGWTEFEIWYGLRLVDMSGCGLGDWCRYCTLLSQPSSDGFMWGHKNMG